jgi:Tfp pilus assembly protein PilF
MIVCLLPKNPTMLPLFKRKQPLQPTVTPYDKRWIEESFDWLIKTFSFAKAKDLPFILPKRKAASSGKAIATDPLQAILENLCKRWEIDPASVVLEIFNDRPSQKWYSFFLPEKDYSGPAGTYQELYEGTQKKSLIRIGQSNLKYHDITTAILAHELAHAKLLGEEYIPVQAPHMEPLTDLTCIYFGFGILFANTCFLDRRDKMGTFSYLPNPMISYANALLCYITEFDPATVIAHLNGNTRELFKRDYNYLITTNDTLLTKAHIQKSDQQFHDHAMIYKAWKEKNFDFIIKNANNLLSKDANDDFLLNIVGYAYIETKQYRAAIDAFNKAITISPHWDHPYNNRGYCLLLLGEVDIAYPDLQRAMEINNGNSYTWRHLGIYSMLKNDLPKALEYLEEAEKIDPGTWTINYYLGLAHHRSGNTEKASEYFTRSKDRTEPIDLIFSPAD